VPIAGRSTRFGVSIYLGLLQDHNGQRYTFRSCARRTQLAGSVGRGTKIQENSTAHDRLGRVRDEKRDGSVDLLKARRRQHSVAEGEPTRELYRSDEDRQKRGEVRRYHSVSSVRSVRVCFEGRKMLTAGSRTRCLEPRL
jgi:hypothetical protein